VKQDVNTVSIRTVRPDGSIEWRNREGKIHREDGPAKEWPAKGAKAWYRDGKLTVTTARRWTALLARAGTGMESGIGKTDPPLKMLMAGKSGIGRARNSPPPRSQHSGRRNVPGSEMPSKPG
jgi:hypothetical protein